MNARERIADARFFVWNGMKLEATPGFYAGLLDALRRHHEGEVETQVAVDNSVLNLVQTETEDLLDLCRDSQLALARARARSTAA